MSERNNGGPAFPIPLNPGQSYTAHAPCDGMTLRDYFAAKAMQAIISAVNSTDVFGQINGNDIHYARAAYSVADAMLSARGAA